MPKSKPKYSTYAELSAAFKSGELDRKRYFIQLDKSGTENSFSWINDDNLSDVENDQKQDECDMIFVPPNDEIESLFEALGIPAEWC